MSCRDSSGERDIDIDNVVFCDYVYVGHFEFKLCSLTNYADFFSVRQKLLSEIFMLKSSKKAFKINSLLILVKCVGKPVQAPNSRLICEPGVSCQVSCLDDHKFPNGETNMVYGCINGKWLLKSLDYNEIPPCERKFSALKMHFSIV